MDIYESKGQEMIMAIGIWVVTYIYDLYTDLKAKRVNHFRGGLLRIPSFTAIYFLTKDWYFIAVALSAYFLLFDVGFALGRKQHPFWTGSTGFLDRLQSPLPLWLRGTIKILLVAISLYLYMKKAA